MKTTTGRIAAIAALVTGLGGAASAQEYPFRDITTAVVWGAGGGTDSVNRMIMAEMENYLPVSINVINQTGGVAGSNGMVYVKNQADDGYTLVGIAEANVSAAVTGGWDQRFDFWYPFIVGGSPDLISVPATSPYTTLAEVIDAAKAAPGTIPAAASGSGGLHHLNLLALQSATNAMFNFIPYDGSAAGQEAAMAGEVALVITSLAEQAALIEGGELRPIAMLTPDEATIGGVTVPSAFDIYEGLDEYLPIKQSLGFAVANSASDEVKDVLVEAFNKAMASDAVAEWALANHYSTSGLSGAEATALYKDLEETFACTLDELGALEIDPSIFGIVCE